MSSQADPCPPGGPGPRLSLVLIGSGHARGLSRTLLSLGPAYQRGIDEADYEIVLVDDGSSGPPPPADRPDLRARLRILSRPEASGSLAKALNLGLGAARGELVGTFVAGARLASPGLLAGAEAASRLHPRAVVSARSLALGAGAGAVRDDHGPAAESRFLEATGWPRDGYRLFGVAPRPDRTPGDGSACDPLVASGAYFMPRTLWDEVGGFDEGLRTADGGLVHADLLARAAGLPGARLVALEGEATFHLAGSGSAGAAEATRDEYRRLRGRPLRLAADTTVPTFDLGAGSGARPFRCLHHAVAAQARAAPARAAVVCGESRLTYGELAARAGRFADLLVGHGVTPGTTVGLAAGRSLGAVVGALAILEAGGAVVPLAPDDPKPRLATILARAGCPILLTEAHLLPGLPAGGHLIACLDRDWPAPPPDPPAPAPAPADGESPAYALFTTGDDGEPAGAQLSHANLMAALGAQGRLLREPPGAVGTCVMPFGSDVSLGELWGCLAAGGTVHLLGPEHATDGSRFARYLADHAVTAAVVPPALLADLAPHLAGLAGRLRLRSLRTGTYGVRAHVLQAWRDAVPGLRILHAYGQPETAGWALAYEFGQAGDPEADLPVGAPLPGYSAQVLDGRLAPAAPGEAGELFLGGAAVGRGYLGSASATTRAFVPDPAGSASGAWLHRTGDRARLRPDGNIELLGRTDDRLRIRGLRVDPAEVEAALARVPGVTECAVVAVPEPDRGLELLAYFVGGALPPRRALRATLRGWLPDAMIPTAFMPIVAPPRTADGRIDRAALRPGAPRVRVLEDTAQGPAPPVHSDHDSREGAAGSPAPEPPAGPLARQGAIVRSWKGHRAAPGSLVVTWNGIGRRPGLFWVLQGPRELQQLARHLGADQPVHGMRSGYLVARTEDDYRLLAARYAAELAELQPAGPFFLGGNCQGGWIASRLARALRDRGRSVTRLFLMEQFEFHPWDGPVTLLFGHQSALNPYLSGADPADRFRAAYPAGFTVELVSGTHGQFFESPHVEDLTAALARGLAAPA